MSRLKSLKKLYKIAHSSEQSSELRKIKQTEERVGMKLSEFEDKVGVLIISKGLKRSGFEFDELEVGGRDILEEILQNPNVWSDRTFEYPYDFLSAGRTPEEYVLYLEDKNIILL